jgi:hypothetical protein
VINAKQLEIRENGDVIRFGGGVRMIVQPERIAAVQNSDEPTLH